MSGSNKGQFKPGNQLRRVGTMARCPHCEAPAFIRTSEEITILHRDVYFICSNPECGHSWKAQLSFVHTIGMPATPRPGLDLPVRIDPRRANDKSGADPPLKASAGG